MTNGKRSWLGRLWLNDAILGLSLAEIVGTVAVLGAAAWAVWSYL